MRLGSTKKRFINKSLSDLLKERIVNIYPAWNKVKAILRDHNVDVEESEWEFGDCGRLNLNLLDYDSGESFDNCFLVIGWDDGGFHTAYIS